MLLTAEMPGRIRIPATAGMPAIARTAASRNTGNSMGTIIIRDKIYAVVFVNKLL
jgi:hypothetical protein